MSLFNEILVSLYLYGYLLLTDYSAGNEEVQDNGGLGMLSVLFLSIGANCFYLACNIVLVVRKRFRRWWWLERTWCRYKRVDHDKPEKKSRKVLSDKGSLPLDLTATSVILDL